MANRPCRADSDLKDIWRLLMPGTPLPACETPENSNKEKSQPALQRADDQTQTRSKPR
jgi:hypothetical protein